MADPDPWELLCWGSRSPAGAQGLTVRSAAAQAQARQHWEHTPPVCAQSRSQRPRVHHARPQLKQYLKAAALRSPADFREL